MRQCKHWSKEELALLLNLVKTRSSTKAIARQLHRSRSSISGKLYRLGISLKETRPKHIVQKETYESVNELHPCIVSSIIGSIIVGVCMLASALILAYFL